MSKPTSIQLHSLAPHEAEDLLSKLCVELGFCLEPKARSRLAKSPPKTIDKFTDAVIVLEGLNPATIPGELRTGARRLVEAAFERSIASIGDISQTLAIFAERFVRAEFAERFLHEAAGRPADLHRRICHDIEKIFDKRYRGRSAEFQASARCLLLKWSAPLCIVTWVQAKAHMEHGGGGYLVIKADGLAFHAETEGYPPEVYASGD